MQKIFLISMDSLIPILFWGNAISFCFLLSYYTKNKNAKERQIMKFLIVARILHACYYLTTTGRGILPDWLSVRVSLTALYIGYYFEAQGVLRIIKDNTRRTGWLLGGIAALFIVLFNIIENYFPLGGIRITMASLGVVAIMAMPAIRMMISRDPGVYTKPVAVFHIIFLALLLVRAVWGLYDRDTGIMTTNILQCITFLSLLLQMIIALPSYTLIIKGYADEALLLMATTDRLTGSTNRHAFMNAAGAIYKNSNQYGFYLSALFLDIDHFKEVNDTYGHAFGDEVLTRLAALIDGCLRESDLSCRYGGEEFVVLLPRSDSQAARTVAERIMHGVRDARFQQYPDFRFTVCIGISSGIPLRDRSIEDVIRNADQAMYRGKRTGRDRIILFDDLESAADAANLVNA